MPLVSMVQTASVGVMCRWHNTFNHRLLKLMNGFNYNKLAEIESKLLLHILWLASLLVSEKSVPCCDCKYNQCQIHSSLLSPSIKSPERPGGKYQLQGS